MTKTTKNEDNRFKFSIIISIVTIIISAGSLYISWVAIQNSRDALVQVERPILTIKAEKFANEDVYLKMSVSEADKNRIIIKYRIRVKNTGKSIARDISLLSQTDLGFLKGLPEEVKPPQYSTLAPDDSFVIVPELSIRTDSPSVIPYMKAFHQNDFSIYSKIMISYKNNMKPSTEYKKVEAVMIHPKEVEFLGSEEN